jgi:aldehyde dehydrogenase (NAD+)
MTETTSFKWEYARSAEDSSLANIAPKYDLFINGKFVKAQSKKTFSTINPATQGVLSEIAEAGEKNVNAAVQAAKSAQKSWAKLPATERAKYIFRVSRMIQERAKELAVTETLDTGKPIRESRDFDIPAAAAHFFYYAGWADKLEYAFPNRHPKPVGVAAQIIPWNFPLLMAAWKIAPALATGNTAVLKPAESTPLSALKLAEIIRDCELPPGVVNIITGGPETGAMLVRHPDVNKIAFTGSTEVGKLIQKETAGSGKKLTLELGGKGAHIVFDDAAIDQAVEGVVNGIFFNQGQVCCAGSRLFVQENISKEFLDKLKTRISQLTVGDPLDKNTDIGAINSAVHLEKINSYIESGRQDGLEVFQSDCKLPSGGFYARPTLFLNASGSNRVSSEEIFGPVLAVQTFRTIEEVIEKANNTPYGLSAGVWTDKGSKVFNLTSRLHAGVVWANTFNKFDPASPFGGYKESGFGREGGLHGLLPYVRF